MLKVLKFLKEKTKKNIWLYTGYTLEEVREDKLRRKCLEYVDVLVDGRFVKELYDPNLKFRGSSNQRIIKKEDLPTEKLKYEFKQLQDYIKELESWGYLEKIDDKIPLKDNQIKYFGNFRVRLDTNIRMYEVDMWKED